MRSVIPQNRGWRGQLEGWQLGVVAVGIAATTAALLAPLGAEPSFLPVPVVDRREQAYVAAHDHADALAAGATGLPFDVRVVGERMRRFGAASADEMGGAATVELAELRAALVTARKRHGDAALLRLRAVQTEAFLAAVRRWEATGRVDRELDELGGDLVRTAHANCWVDGGRLVLTPAERRTFFRIRWAELASVRDTVPFAPSLNDWRAYFRFLLEHPERSPSSGAGSPPRVPSAVRLLGYVEALARRDPDYPALFARGVILHRLGRYDTAGAAFGAYLDTAGESSLRAWARNHLVSSRALVPPDDFEL
ncbi:MAG: hypothetical protein JW751_31045 [Polyangiaceae bacterium]|nr:hypothetical protein [Polyangiaceae bacterium]